MGNWRTVNITGTMTDEDARKLHGVLDRGDDIGHWPGWGEPYACLSFRSLRPSICGLGTWPTPIMNCCGNLAERDYSVQDVADALTALMPVAPSMLLKVHCGGEYESSECVVTVSTGEGLVVVGKPEVASVAGPSDEQMLGNFVQALARPPSR
jgi:hypothetical protein